MKAIPASLGFSFLLLALMASTSAQAAKDPICTVDLGKVADALFGKDSVREVPSDELYSQTNHLHIPWVKALREIPKEKLIPQSLHSRLQEVEIKITSEELWQVGEKCGDFILERLHILLRGKDFLTVSLAQTELNPESLTVENLRIRQLMQGRGKGVDIKTFQELFRILQEFAKSQGFKSLIVHGVSNYSVSILYRRFLKLRPVSEKSKAFYERVDGLYKRGNLAELEAEFEGHGTDWLSQNTALTFDLY